MSDYYGGLTRRNSTRPKSPSRTKSPSRSKRSLESVYLAADTKKMPECDQESYINSKFPDFSAIASETCTKLISVIIPSNDKSRQMLDGVTNGDVKMFNEFKKHILSFPVYNRQEAEANKDRMYTYSLERLDVDKIEGKDDNNFKIILKNKTVLEHSYIKFGFNDKERNSIFKIVEGKDLALVDKVENKFSFPPKIRNKFNKIDSKNASNALNNLMSNLRTISGGTIFSADIHKRIALTILNMHPEPELRSILLFLCGPEYTHLNIIMAYSVACALSAELGLKSRFRDLTYDPQQDIDESAFIEEVEKITMHVNSRRDVIDNLLTDNPVDDPYDIIPENCNLKLSKLKGQSKRAFVLLLLVIRAWRQTQSEISHEIALFCLRLRTLAEEEEVVLTQPEMMYISEIITTGHKSKGKYGGANDSDEEHDEDLTDYDEEDW